MPYLRTKAMDSPKLRQTPFMHWEVGESVTHPGYFSVEAIDDELDGEGEVYVTVFLGSRSEERAKEFAHWQNGLLEWKRHSQRGLR